MKITVISQNNPEDQRERPLKTWAQADGDERGTGIAHLEKLQEGGLGHTGLLDERHGVGEVVDIVAVHVQHHRLGELQKTHGWR